MTAPRFSATGEKTGEVELDARLFAVAPNPRLIQQVVVVQQSSARRPIAHTKTRAEVSGGGKKPWRQKGTGRARHGSIRSPIWRGGGITFGPRNTRNFHRDIPVKARRKAVAMVLTDRAKDGQLAILERPTLEKPKTKQIVQLIAKLPVKAPTLLILPERNLALIRSARNAPALSTIGAQSINVLDLLRHRSLVLVDGALERMVATFAR